MLTALFIPKPVFVAQETKLNLNLESKTVTIEYKDLTTSNDAAAFARNGLNEIEEATGFHKNYPEVELLSKSIEKKGGKLNARVTCSFNNQEQVLRLLRFNLTRSGESTSSDGLYYHLLPSEDLTSSNGIEIEHKDGILLKWDKNSTEIQMELRQNESAKEYLGEMVSIANYWK